MEKPCPHGRLTNKSPCFREEGTFLSDDGGQALGWVPAFLDFWIFWGPHPHKDASLLCGLGWAVRGGGSWTGGRTLCPRFP